MIISLRGTSGAGKSHLTRRVAALYERHRDFFGGDRRRPWYSVHGRNPEGRVLVVPGHYQIANGGVDTLPTLDKAYEIATWGNRRGHDVLMEGKNMSDGTKRVDDLHSSGIDVRIVLLDVPLADCVASVRSRGHSIAASSIDKTRAKVERDYEKFTCEKFRGSRDECFELVRRWLGV